MVALTGAVAILGWGPEDVDLELCDSGKFSAFSDLALVVFSPVFSGLAREAPHALRLIARMIDT